MSFALGRLGARRRAEISILYPTAPTIIVTYDDLVNSFGSSVVSYWKFQNTGTDERGVGNATITGNPELNVETIVDMDRVSEGASVDGKCIAWPGQIGESAQASHNSAHKTASGTVVVNFQCDTLNEKSTLIDADHNGAAGGLGMEVQTNGALRAFLRNTSATPVVLVSTAGDVQLNQAYTMILRWGSGGLSASLWNDAGTLIRRLTNPVTDGASGTSPITFGAYHADLSHHDGPFARVVWMNRRITDAEEATLAKARSILRGAAPTVGKFVSTTGNDANDGSLDHPWRTIPFGVSQLNPGETLWVRGGRYTGDFTLSKSGTAVNPITIESYPGEIAVVDVCFEEFQTVSNGQWQLDPESPVGTEVYRSVGTNYATSGATRGTFWVDDPAIGTVLSSMRPYENLAQIRSQVYTFVDVTYEYYGGPGFCFANGRIYVRLQNLASPRNAGVPAEAIASAVGDINNHPPSAGGFNPNNFSINLSTARNNIIISGAYVKLRRLHVNGGQYGVQINGASGAHHVTVENCRLWGATHPMTNGTVSNDCTMRRCHVMSGFSPCFSWAEIHTVGTDHHPRMESKIWSLAGDDQNILLEENYVQACFDGCSGVASGIRNLRLIRNTIVFLFDDLIQFNGQATFEVGWNYVGGPGPGYNGNDVGTAEDTKFVHHNVFEDRRGEFGWRWNLGAIYTGPGPVPWRDSHNPFASHSVANDCNTPMKIYSNTIFYRSNINARGARLERVGGKTAGKHESYNNIVFGFQNANCYYRGVTVGTNDQIHDYNLMWHTGSYGVALMRDMLGTANNDYATLAAWLAGQSFQDTKSVYGPGFEANSKEGDPSYQTGTRDSAFGSPTLDYRPSAAGIAASGAKNMGSTGWPGTSTAAYFGAVDPNATTGLGAVGIPAGVTVGP